MHLGVLCLRPPIRGLQAPAFPADPGSRDGHQEPDKRPRQAGARHRRPARTQAPRGPHRRVPGGQPRRQGDRTREQGRGRRFDGHAGGPADRGAERNAEPDRPPHPEQPQGADHPGVGARRVRVPRSAGPGRDRAEHPGPPHEPGGRGADERPRGQGRGLALVVFGPRPPPPVCKVDPPRDPGEQAGVCLPGGGRRARRANRPPHRPAAEGTSRPHRYGQLLPPHQQRQGLFGRAAHLLWARWRHATAAVRRRGHGLWAGRGILVPAPVPLAVPPGGHAAARREQGLRGAARH